MQSSHNPLADYRCRVNFEIDKGLRDSMNGLVPWGARAGFMRGLVQAAVDKMEGDKDRRTRVLNAIQAGFIEIKVKYPTEEGD